MVIWYLLGLLLYTTLIGYSAYSLGLDKGFIRGLSTRLIRGRAI